jgi:hypothetical protein
MPVLGLLQLVAKRVEPPPNLIGVTAAILAAGLFLGSGHWHCSISGKAFRTDWSRAWPAL